jgi:hypothetical protein
MISINLKSCPDPDPHQSENRVSDPDLNHSVSDPQHWFAANEQTHAARRGLQCKNVSRDLKFS